MTMKARLLAMVLAAALCGVAAAQTPPTAPDGTPLSGANLFDANILPYLDVEGMLWTVGALLFGYAAFMVVSVGSLLLSAGPIGGIAGLIVGGASSARTILRSLGRLLGSVLEAVFWFFLMAAIVCSVLSFVFNIILPDGVDFVLDFALPEDNDLVDQWLAWVSYLWWIGRGQEILSVWLTAIGWKIVANSFMVVLSRGHSTAGMLMQ